MRAHRQVALGSLVCAALVVLAFVETQRLGWRHSDQDEEKSRALELEADRRLLLESIKVNEKARADLIAGQLSLRQALVILKWEHLRRPPHLRGPLVFSSGRTVEARLAESGRTEQERFAREVVRQVKGQMEGHSWQQRRLGEIEKELASYLAEEEAFRRGVDLFGPFGTRGGCGPR